ncbi:MAG: hypothetical protein J6M90_06505 [Oscillospiraceae bacterium]|nr:hypothetical protein [Oscillospiraceae bacterium]
MTGTYRFADRVVSITSVYEDVHIMCRGYEADGTPDITVNTDERHIAAERERSAKNDIAEGRKVQLFSNGYLETLAVYRQIAEAMPAFDTVLFHGSVIAVDGKAYIFTAKSGTGKSTHTRLWRELLGDRAVMVNDDKPLLSVKDGVVYAYGTPWNGKHRLGENICCPVRALAVLHRGEENSISPISVQQAYPVCMQQMYRPSSGIALSKSMGLLDGMLGSIGLFRLYCNMDILAAKTAYEAMSK